MSRIYDHKIIKKVESIAGTLLVIAVDNGDIDYVLESTYTPSRRAFEEFWHREDGPALSSVEYANDICAWWWLNEGMSFDKWLDTNTVLTPEEKVLMKLQYVE